MELENWGRTMERAILLRSALALVLVAASANASILVSFTDASGLSAEAEFTLTNSTTLDIRLKNTSTAVPMGFSNSDQLLTGLSWDFGSAGDMAGEADILGGSAEVGTSSASVNFDNVMSQLGPGGDIGGEWGYGNGAISGSLTNFVSGNMSGTTAFGGANLDGPTVLDGPQAGLVANPILVDLAGLGAIRNEILMTITLSKPITEQYLQDSFDENGVQVEFGSDAAFIFVPEPASLAFVGIAGVASLLRRRRA